MSIFNRNKKKQLETEWQLVEQREGESLFDLLQRVAAGEGLIPKETPKRAVGEIPRPPTDGEWLMAASIAKLSSRAMESGLQAVRHARKVGMN